MKDGSFKPLIDKIHAEITALKAQHAAQLAPLYDAIDVLTGSKRVPAEKMPEVKWKELPTAVKAAKPTKRRRRNPFRKGAYARGPGRSGQVIETLAEAMVKPTTLADVTATAGKMGVPKGSVWYGLQRLLRDGVLVRTENAAYIRKDVLKEEAHASR